MSNDPEFFWLDEHGVVTLVELTEFSGLAEAELLELVHAGVIEPREPAALSLTFSARSLTVARTASRLRDDFELDVRGLSLALKLLERVQELESELAHARALLPRS